MAEIGIAASVIAIIQLADRIVELCKFYIESLSDAPSDIRVIFVEISTLKTLFENLRFLLTSDHSASEILKLLSDSNGPIEGCLKSVTELEKLFPPDSVQNSSQSASHSKRRKMNVAITTLAWPLKTSKAQRLLQQIVQYKSSISLVLTTDLSQDIKNIKKQNEEIHNILTDSQRQEVLNWLQHTDPSPLHNKARKNYEPGTGNWVLRSSDWTGWLDVQYRCLWIHGIPGAGKTILASFLIEQIEKKCDQSSNGNKFYGFYYCYFGRNQDEAVPFLCWVICQLCRQMDFVPNEVQKLHKRAGEPTIEELLTAVEAVIQSCEVVYIVIDAIDESSSRGDLLKVVRDLVTDARFSKIQILATSRDYIDIEKTMENISKSVTMTNPLVEEDIRIFVKSHLSSNGRFKRWPQDLLSETEEAVTVGAKGMFRWAVCQLDILQRLKCERKIVKNALATLPKTLDETYERLFLSIPRDEWSLVHRALQWVHYHNELYDGEGIPCSILLQAIQNNSDPLIEVSPDQFYDIDRLRELCGCLISVMTEDDTEMLGSEPADHVSFAHYTVREYLGSTRISKSPAAYFAICTIATKQQLTKIAILQAQNINPDQDFSLEKHVVTSPNYDCLIYDIWSENFTAYCVVSAILSITLFQEDIYKLDKLFETVKEFLDPSKPHFAKICLLATIISAGTAFFENANLYEYSQFFRVLWSTNPNEIEAAILLQLLILSADHYPVLARKILEQRDNRSFLLSNLKFSKPVWNLFSDNEVTDYEFDGTIIEVIAQCAYQHPGAFELILDYGVGFFDPSYILLLYIGSREEDTNLLLRLLQAEADPNVRGYRVTPLQIATASWDYQGVEILLQAGADPSGIGDINGVEWKAKTLFSRYNFLRGLSPLHICRNISCVFEDGRRDESSSNVGKIESLLLQYGGIEIRRDKYI